MPTEEFLLNIDLGKMRKSLFEVLDYTGDIPLVLAVIVIFESLVVVASLDDGYTKANTECLRKRDRYATKTIKRFRDLSAHAYYDKDKLKDSAIQIVHTCTIQRLFRQFYNDKEVLQKCRDFEQRLSNLFKSTNSVNPYAKKIYDRIPPSVLKKYNGTVEEIALQFTAEVLL